MAGDKAIELFDQFVRQYVDPSLHAHFADNDNNAAERVREAIRAAVSGTGRSKPFQVRELIEPYLNRWGQSDVGDVARRIRTVLDSPTT